MKIAFFELRKDEEEILKKLEKEYSVDVVKTEEILTQETLLMAKGCEGISILGHSKLERDLLDSIKGRNKIHIYQNNWLQSYRYRAC